MDDAIKDFLETWGSHCGAPRSVFAGHVKVLANAIQDEAHELLIDCWLQWSIELEDGRRTHGCLSTLESLLCYLMKHGLIDANGRVVKT